MKKIVIGSVLALLVTACTTSTPTTSSPLTKQGDTLCIEAGSPLSQKIETLKIDSIAHCSSFETVGTVRAAAGKMAEVGAPMDGRTTHSHVRLGQQVRAGQPLFGFHSAEFVELSKSYFQSRSTYELEQKNLQRKRVLLESGVASQREYDEAVNAEDLALRELRQNEQTIRILGVSVEHLEETGSMDVCAPIAGEVVMCELTNGQFVRSDGPSIITIADLSEVWVSAQLKENNLGRVQENDSVIISLPAGDKLPGRIHYIGQLLDEQTRSAQVLVSCQNPNHLLKPGMYVHVQFVSSPAQALIVPSSAVLQQEESTYVFAEVSPDRYVRRVVDVESISTDSVRIVSGLSAGERIVVRGGIYIGE